MIIAITIFLYRIDADEETLESDQNSEKQTILSG